MALIAKVDICNGCDDDFVKAGEDASLVPEPMRSQYIRAGVICDDDINIPVIQSKKIPKDCCEETKCMLTKIAACLLGKSLDCNDNPLMCNGNPLIVKQGDCC